jgi:hypothetical protein
MADSHYNPNQQYVPPARSDPINLVVPLVTGYADPSGVNADPRSAAAAALAAFDIANKSSRVVPLTGLR